MKRMINKNAIEIKLLCKALCAILVVLYCALFTACGIAVPGSAGKPGSIGEPGSAGEQGGIRDEDDFEEKAVKIFEWEPTDREVTLRFYKDAPNVPYMGIGEYFDLMLGGGLTVTEQLGGKYLLTNAAGATAEVDTGNGIVAIPMRQREANAALSGTATFR